MDGEDRLRTMWRNLKQRLGFTGLACCGSSWNLRVSDVTMREEEETEQAQQIQAQLFGEEPMIAAHQGNVDLATALAAERRYRSVDTTAQLKTLMRLFEETDGRDEKKSLKWYIKEEGRGGIDEMCCVCMERNKGAAFIPCGHTYCRVCSRELWLNRGLCPLCNCSIKEILNIF
ncbi:putative E3 ubiquitin-protein ligase XBAT35 [Solanum dulcamara]|uniref:putative E3 ubiquitin-protein ligase XBAT35 n=1 Tax=Solanum dulcamara TaxID=45834 RepID=UPI00248570FF|nr:putative E3 ubiquitin-protein ligase XBAT35 [Solanum dulcamara]